MFPPESKRVHFRPSVSALRAQPLSLIEQSGSREFNYNFQKNVPLSEAASGRIPSAPAHCGGIHNRLSDKREWLGSEGRHGWTKLDTSWFRGRHWGDLGYRSKFMVPANLVHVVLGPARGTWDRHNHRIFENQKHPSKFGDEEWIFSKKYKDQNDRIGKIYQFKKWLDRFSLKT